MQIKNCFLKLGMAQKYANKELFLETRDGPEICKLRIVSWN